MVTDKGNTIASENVVEVFNVVDILCLVETNVWREYGSLVILPYTEQCIFAASFVDSVKEELHANDGVAVVENDDEQEEAEETRRNFNKSVQQVPVAVLDFYQPTNKRIIVF